MPIADQLRSAARVPFGVLRSCVTAVDRRVGPVVSSVPVVGAVAAKVRGTHVSTAGGMQPEPAEPPAREPEPATTADREDVMPEPSTESPQDQVEHLAEELLEDEADHQTGELADNDELRRVQAELRAKHALQENS